MHYIFPYFIILVIILQLVIRKNTRKQEQREHDYYERERRANLVRRQDISKLDYISLPDDIFLLDKSSSGDFLSLYENNPSIRESYSSLLKLKDSLILNLNGISNTDLKLKYGVANLTQLTEYDDNYTDLIKSLANLGHALIEAGQTEYAKIFLEYAISIGSDIRSNYADLAVIYISENNHDKINSLIDTVSDMDSINRDIILEQLNDML